MIGQMHGFAAIVGLCAALVGAAGRAAAAQPSLYSKEYTITVDATGLKPPTWWQVPGVTPMIMTLDPETTDAYRTTMARDLKLKPGNYRFGTFTFDFPFAVTLEGVLDYSRSLDQCVTGRGTQKLTVVCSRTQPYGGKPEYYGTDDGAGGPK